MNVSKVYLVICLIPIICAASVRPSEFIRFAEDFLFRSAAVLQKALFVPDDPVKKILLGLIDAEKVSLQAALFRLSDGDIAQRLVDAANRGVKVRVIMDCTGIGDQYSKIDILMKAKIPIWMYREVHSTMHHKFFVFEKNVRGKKILWTGSSNPTVSGVTKNQENVIVTEDRTLCASFSMKFESLIKDSTKMSGKVKRSKTDKLEKPLYGSIKRAFTRIIKTVPKAAIF